MLRVQKRQKKKNSGPKVYSVIKAWVVLLSGSVRGRSGEGVKQRCGWEWGLVSENAVPLGLSLPGPPGLLISVVATERQERQSLSKEKRGPSYRIGASRLPRPACCSEPAAAAAGGMSV